jgi:hypothetical protein
VRDRLRLARAAEADLGEARALSDSKTLARRLEDAIDWAALSVLEIARTARDEDDLAPMLEGELLPSLRQLSDARKRR